jgi:hypothetical protein
VNSLARVELPHDDPAVAIVAEAKLARRRLAGALASSPAFHLRAIPWLRRLIETAVVDDAIVTYHERLCAEGCEWVMRVKATFAEVAIVAVCESVDGRTVRRALDSGIDGLVFAGELEASLRAHGRNGAGRADRCPGQPTEVYTQTIVVPERAESA